MPEDTVKTITVTHLNVRQSISFMLLRFCVVEVIFDTLILFLYLPLSYLEFPFERTGDLLSTENILFLILVAGKMFFSLFVVLQWLNEYYEILPQKFIHKKGVIFKYEEEYIFSHIMSVDYEQSFLGEFFNYGTIHMYDRYISRDIYMYLIHNPRKYFKILKDLIPITDTEQEVFRGSIDEIESQ